MRTAIFDLDGTLVDTAVDLVAAMNALADEEGFAPLDPVTHRAVAGAGGRALIRAAMTRTGLTPDEDRVAALWPRYLAHYADHVTGRSTLFPGARACLDGLAAGGWRLGLCTNKPEGLARQVLDHFDITRCFGAILGADTLPVKKPDPRHLTETIARCGGAQGGAVLIGDTMTDRATARAAGVPCILTRFGYAVEAPEALAPEGWVDDLAEVPPLAARLLAR
jgi:phosphoglycolate phosphatase